MVLHCNPSLRDYRTGAQQGRRLQAGSMEGCHLVVWFHCLLSLISYRIQDHQPSNGTGHKVYLPPSFTTLKKSNSWTRGWSCICCLHACAFHSCIWAGWSDLGGQRPSDLKCSYGCGRAMILRGGIPFLKGEEKRGMKEHLCEGVPG
jgi:hypothetical protein